MDLNTVECFFKSTTNSNTRYLCSVDLYEVFAQGDVNLIITLCTYMFSTSCSTQFFESNEKCMILYY